jgi:hypothetical protein
MMNFLRSLFGGPRGSAADRSGLYVYVRPTGCDEVIRVRINLLNDLSESDEGGSYFVHKLARGVKCRQNIEIDLAFDGQRRIREQHITGGEFVDAAAYEAWLQASPPPAAP